MNVTHERNRRQHRRHTARVFMEIRGPVQGAKVAEAKGVTVDMSCGGALAVFTGHLSANPGDTFMVRFVDATGDVIAPDFRWGTVLRSDHVNADCVVAVEFQKLLPTAVLRRLLSADLAPAERASA